jgi:hypothetical protein
MNKAVFLLLLSCYSPYRMFKKNQITLSESVCVDGTIVNIAEAGCESFYWGAPMRARFLKIRCTYSEEINFWTEMDFYAVPNNYDLAKTSWGTYCKDHHVKMYALPRGARLNESR